MADDDSDEERVTLFYDLFFIIYQSLNLKIKLKRKE
jgi:hypothetical protein